MNTVRTLATVAALSLGMVTAAHAQFAVEGRVGAAIPTGDDFGETATTGFGFEGNVAYGVMPLLEVYAGASWTRFGVDSEEAEEVDAHFTDLGFSAGARVNLPGAIVQPWLRGGLIYHRLQISGEEGGFEASFKTDWALGFEVGGGGGIPVAPTVVITPGVRYRSYSPEVSFGELTGDADVNSVVIDIGARLTI